MELIKTFPHPKIPELQIKFYAGWEELRLEGHFSWQQDIDYIQKEIDNGNMAAWFIAKIEVNYMGLICTDYLGGCSYKSFDEFLEAGDYCSDMIDNVTSELKNQLIKIMGSAEHMIYNIEKVEKCL